MVDRVTVPRTNVTSTIMTGGLNPAVTAIFVLTTAQISHIIGSVTVSTCHNLCTHAMSSFLQIKNLMDCH